MILGLASLHDGYSTWQAMPVGEVQDVYVAEAARRTGVATGLFEFLMAEAKRRGYCKLTLDVMADNDAARLFYEGYGLHDTGYVVYVVELAGDG